ncbi:MAG: response regulator [Colwellia sp.]|nr:response regulator [Colwellia sp.]MCW8864637.1 response regulator [Colwellia sp.]
MSTISYQNKNFLIIDNIKPSHDILRKFAMSLTSKQVDSTLYAQDVIPMCLEKQYDIIFLGYDLGEKQKNGQQILEELRISEVISRHCIVIIITAEVSQAMVLAALEHKPDSYLCKPYSLQELHTRLNKCMAKKVAMHEIYSAIEEDDKNLTITLVNNALADNTPYKMECLGIKSRQFFELQKFDHAHQIYTSLKDSSNCQWASIGLGKIALQKNELANAETIFKTVIQEHPLYLPTYDWLASTYLQRLNNANAEKILEQAIKLSPRSVVRLKKYANLCFENEHFEKATDAFQQVYNLASNSIHQTPENALMFAKSLAGYSADLPLIEAKKMNNRAFAMLSQMNKNYQKADLKIQAHLLSACLFENIHDYIVAKSKLELGLNLLDKERQNIEPDSLTSIADSLTKLNRNNKASQILMYANKQHANNTNSSGKIGELSHQQLNEGQTEKAQKALEFSKQLFEEKEYNKAMAALNEALQLFPQHTGIKLNLLQVLLTSYEEDKFKIDDLKKAKKIILELLNISKGDEGYNRLKKMKKKYQQLAGI